MSIATTPLDRRRFLVGAGAAGALVAAGPLARRASAAEPELAPFSHGVASGDPLPDGVMLWTRLDPPPGAPAPVTLRWRIATASDLTGVVASGDAVADPATDWCVKVDVRGLAPATTYYYGFSSGDLHSLTGRTRTAPTGGVDQLRFGVVSCSNLPAGWFNGYRLLAERQDLDAVLHLGDYLYEYGNGQYGGARTVQPDHEMVTIEDYRLRWSSYRLDPDLRRLHQQYAFVCVWDDHESTNDSWRDGAENHNPEQGEGDWFTRKEIAGRVYAEWLPIRLPSQDGRSADDGTRIYRSLRYGDLLDLVMIDTRLEGRSEQSSAGPDPESDDPSRTLLGFAQERWLVDELAASQARGAAWRIVGQQVMLAHLDAAGLPDTPQFRSTRRGGVALNADQWDGYPGSRRRLHDALRGANPAQTPIDNLVVLTGDIHTSWANDLPEDPHNPALYNPVTGEGSLGVEFVTPSITSGNFESLGPGVPAAEAAVRGANPHIKYTDLDAHGYLVLDVTPQRVRSDWFVVDTIAERTGGETHAAAWQTADGSNHLSAATGAVPTGTAAIAAPVDPPSGGPDPAVPEIASPALLPLAAIAASVGAAVAVRRRNRPLDPTN